jgi:hypothetical protein
MNTLKISASDRQWIHDSESKRLIFGPYNAPAVRVGDELQCQIFGLQVVKGWHGPKQWPQARASGRPRLIVSEELMRAILQETPETVSVHWGVHTSTVKKWRQRISVDRPSTASTEFRSARMRYLRASMPETFVLPGKKFLLNLSTAARTNLGKSTAGLNAWEKKELDVLATHNNADASKLLGRSMSSVGNARQRYRLPHPGTECTCPHCGYRWKSYLARIPKLCANHCCSKRLGT